MALLECSDECRVVACFLLMPIPRHYSMGVGAGQSYDVDVESMTQDMTDAIAEMEFRWKPSLCSDSYMDVCAFQADQCDCKGGGAGASGFAVLAPFLR